MYVLSERVSVYVDLDINFGLKNLGFVVDAVELCCCHGFGSMFFRLLCQLDYQPFCCFVVGGKHLHLLVVIIIYSYSNIHLSSLISSFFQNLSSLYVPLSLFQKKAVVCLCVFRKTHATDFFDLYLV